MTRILRFVSGLGVVLLVLVTIAGHVPSDQSYIRMWDFPRVAISAAGFVVLVLALAAHRGHARVSLALLALGALGLQAARIAPMTPLWAPEVMDAEPSSFDGPDHFTLLTLNVLQHNQEREVVGALIEREAPDVLLLLETDESWLTDLAPAVESYAFALTEPQSNTYGIALYSRLPVDRAEIRHLTGQDQPSIEAVVRTRGGRPFRLLGLHPRPPRIGHDTTERDRELLLAAEIAQEGDLPCLALGDFNDVAWSRTTAAFKERGGFLDPRVGRGFYGTFPASLPWFRWPLDHVFMTDEFRFGWKRVSEDVGSDHRAVIACFQLPAG